MPTSPTLMTDPNSPRPRQWLGQPSIAGRSEFVQMFLLTVAVAGLQFTWGVEMSYVNMFLLSLGLTKNLLSIVWVAGPLSGLLMQPLVGVLSDNSTSKYGRRRPYILVGSFIVTGGLCTMAWSKEIVGLFVESQFLTILLAVFAVFVTDFAVNAVQACCRAIIVDTLPTSKQQLGNGWAGRMIAVGHLLGYFAGYVDLVSFFNGWVGDTQLKSLCVVSGFALISTCSITCMAVTERVLTVPQGPHGRNQQDRRNLLSSAFAQTVDIFRTLIGTVWSLPVRMRLIFKTQLFAWYGWFTFLFYSSTWVSEVNIKYSVASLKQRDADKVGDMARVGSMSLMVFSLVSLVCSLILPELVKRKWLGVNLAGLWLLSHIIYSIASLLTGFVESVQLATGIVAVYGFSWAVTTWAPFALLAEEILKLSVNDYELAPMNELEDEEDQIEHMDISQPLPQPHDSSPTSPAAALGTTGEKSGIYLGIHNVAITMPQFVSTLGSFVIFSILQVDTSTDDRSLPTEPGEGDGGKAIARTLQVGSITSLVAAYYVRKLQQT